jgi:hypothetical protein
MLKRCMKVRSVFQLCKVLLAFLLSCILHSTRTENAERDEVYFMQGFSVV